MAEKYMLMAYYWLYSVPVRIEEEEEGRIRGIGGLEGRMIKGKLKKTSSGNRPERCLNNRPEEIWKEDPDLKNMNGGGER